MYKYLSILCLTLGLVSCDPKQLQTALDMINGATGQFSVADGLKEALNFGVDASVKKLSSDGGYLNSIYKIALPQEAQNVVNVVKKIPGFQNVEANIIAKVNAAAEDAATKATPIFIDAIKSITFDDAMKILKGQDDAATQFLNKRTYSSLFNAFTPVIKTSLNKVGAIDLYADVINAHNKIPLVKDKNPDITKHITDKALVGLFALIAKKEQGIRTDVSQRTTDLLKNVFSQQD